MKLIIMWFVIVGKIAFGVASGVLAVAVGHILSDVTGGGHVVKILGIILVMMLVGYIVIKVGEAIEESKDREIGDEK